MSKESLDYKKLCSNYYSSWEEGCCMESCEFYNHDECPVVYVNGLIADLEAKLAEMQNEKDELISKYRYWRGECAELKQQLAEKDKEIEELKTDLFVKNLDREYDCILGLQNAENDKISFAVEQLEKVVKWVSDNYSYDFLSEIIYKDDFDKFIYNQIKQLKEGK